MKHPPLVKVIYLEANPNGSKVDLGDFFAAGGVVSTLLAQATDTLRKGPAETRDFPYVETPLGFLWKKPTREGPVDVPLCNFTARIVTECEEDDGVEVRRTFDLTVTQGTRTATVRIPWERFNAVNWPIEALGADAAIVPGRERAIMSALRPNCFRKGRRSESSTLTWDGARLASSGSTFMRVAQLVRSEVCQTSRWRFRPRLSGLRFLIRQRERHSPLRFVPVSLCGLSPRRRLPFRS
jgi:hypothetical protein